MKCTICKSKGMDNKAIVDLPAHNIRLCKEHYIEWFERRVERTIKEFRMFTKRDRILVAVSGGKDSLGLWHALNKLGYDADGLHIDLGIYDYSEKSRKITEDFAQKIGRRLYIIDLKKEMGGIPEIKEKIKNKPACSICGTIKRYYMNKVAREEGYNVLATGHNLDDESAVLLNNILNWHLEYLGRQYPVLEEEDGFAKKVKPYFRISEKESTIYTFLNGIKYIEEECPLSIGANSLKYKEILGNIEEKFPGTKLRFLNGYMEKIHPLFEKKEEKELKSMGRCKICGEPSSLDICAVCNIKLKMGKGGE